MLGLCAVWGRQRFGCGAVVMSGENREAGKSASKRLDLVVLDLFSPLL